MTSLEPIKPSRAKVFIRTVAKRLDKAISMGVAAAYPILFTMDAPDPLPDWKDGVRFGWRVVKVTARETVKIIRKGIP
jgi:hypothetical protein